MIAVHAQETAFSGEECDRIVGLADAAPSRDARLVGQTQDHNLRRADLVWLDDVPGSDWVMDRIIDVVRIANRDVFGFDLQSFSESAQVAALSIQGSGSGSSLSGCSGRDWSGHTGSRQSIRLCQ